MKNYYQVLEINRDASDAEIKKAYRRLAIKYHPDKNQGDDFFSMKFIEVKEAFDILIDNDRRKKFDAEYANFTTQQTKKEQQAQNFQKEKQQSDENERNEKYYYEPFKPFYSSRDRDLHETPQFNPFFDFWGEKLAAEYVFFQLPKRIGKILMAFSSLKQDEKPLTSKQKSFYRIRGLVIGLGISALIIFLGKPSKIWMVIFAIVRKPPVKYRSDYGFRMRSLPVMRKKFIQLTGFGILDPGKDIG